MVHLMAIQPYIIDSFNGPIEKFDFGIQEVKLDIDHSMLNYLGDHHIKLNLEYVFDDKFDWSAYRVSYRINTNTEKFILSTMGRYDIVPGKIYSLLLKN